MWQHAILIDLDHVNCTKQIDTASHLEVEIDAMEASDRLFLLQLLTEQ